MSLRASGEVGSWNSSSRAFGAGTMKMLPFGTPGTRVPAASTSTSRLTRAG